MIKTHISCGKDFTPSLTTSPFHCVYATLTPPFQMNWTHSLHDLRLAITPGNTRKTHYHRHQATGYCTCKNQKKPSPVSTHARLPDQTTSLGVLKDCAEELKDVFADNFNISLSQSVVPTCLKSIIIVPSPKEAEPSLPYLYI